jgi:PAS domain S-box-containing protein
VTELQVAETARRESDERLRATYESATVGLAEVDRDGRYVRVNDALCEILGRSREEVLDTTLVDITHEEDREREAEHYRRQARGELPSYAIEKRAVRPDGTVVWLDVFSSSVCDEHGAYRYGVRVMQDVTERKRMEDEIRASERRMRELLEALPAAIYTIDAEGRLTFYNRAAVDLAGREPELGVDQWCVSWRLRRADGTPLPHDECPMATALKEGRAVRGQEAIAERPDGSQVPFIPFPTPLRDEAGRVVGAINMLVDITSRKQAEAQQRALIDELNHRVKNTLTTVQSLAVHSAKHASSIEEFSSAFQSRLLALAKAHDLLTKRNWAGASLGSLVQDLVAPYAEGERHARVDGLPIELRPHAALSLTMVLNELATNAAKYGALSTPDGTLRVAWETTGEQVYLDWIEQGGPKVTAPTKRGFGTTLMERCIERDLDGRIDCHFEEKGLHCRLTIPMSALTE